MPPLAGPQVNHRFQAQTCASDLRLVPPVQDILLRGKQVIISLYRSALTLTSFARKVPANQSPEGFLIQRFFHLYTIQYKHPPESPIKSHDLFNPGKTQRIHANHEYYIIMLLILHNLSHAIHVSYVLTLMCKYYNRILNKWIH